MSKVLNKQSGFLGLSGVSSDAGAYGFGKRPIAYDGAANEQGGGARECAKAS